VRAPAKIRTAWGVSAPQTVTSAPVRADPNRPRNLRNNPEELTILASMLESEGVSQSRLPTEMQTSLNMCSENTDVGAVASGWPVEADGWAKSVAQFCLCRCTPLFALLLAVSAGLSQPLPPERSQVASGQIQARIIEVARNLKDHPRLKRLAQQERENAVEFIVGNMLFVMLHELGHAAIWDFKLPVLGREEDAADEFAILRMLWVGTAFTDRVLAEATKGWFFSARRDRIDGEPLAFYDEHGLDEQRAYEIVCLMVGHDPNKMVHLANEMKLPSDRRESCKKDFETASSSWASVLKPHQREAGQPMVQIETIYGDGEGDLGSFAQSFRSLRLLEIVAERTADAFAWPAPFTLEMKSCGVINARWTDESCRLTLCYELAVDFAELYRDFNQVAAAKQQSKASARSLKRATRPSSETRTPRIVRGHRYIARTAGHDATATATRAFKRRQRPQSF
jgi:Putative metallopeptidase